MTEPTLTPAVVIGTGLVGASVGAALTTAGVEVHLVDAVACGVGFLFPLWDTKRQTLADKLMGTVCIAATGTR